MKTLLKNGRIIDPILNLDRVADIFINDGMIEKIGGQIPSSKNMEVIDLDGKIIAPGFIDMHVHLREPGFEHKETIETGCRLCRCRRIYSGLLYAEYESCHR